MMMPIKLRILGVAALTMFGGSAVAQLDVDALPRESLMDIYQRALQNDPQIRQAEANYRAAQEAVPQARSFLLPSVQLSAGMSASNVEDPNPQVRFEDGIPVPDVLGRETRSDTTQWSVNMSQSVFDWGRVTTLRQADRRVAQAEASFELERQQLLLRVAETYFNVLTAQDTLSAQAQARASAGRQLEQAQRRFEVGLIAITDVQEAQAFYDIAVADEIAAQRTVATAQEFLREIIGIYVADLAGPVDDLPLTPPEPANPDEWVSTALRQNLGLVAQRLATDIASDDIAIQRAGRLPTLSLSSGWNDRSTESQTTLNLAPGSTRGQPPSTISENRGWNMSLNLNVPLYTGGLNSSRIQQSVYQHRASMDTLERVARQTEREARDAYLGVMADIQRVGALRQAVESNRTALRATEAGFEVGTRTSVDVIISQDALLRAETNYARSRYDYILNVLRLKQAAGTLGVQDIEEIDGWLQ